MKVYLLSSIVCSIEMFGESNNFVRIKCRVSVYWVYYDEEI